MEYAEPFNSPEECDHEELELNGGSAPCSRCCPCELCGHDRWLDLQASEEER